MSRILRHRCPLCSGTTCVRMVPVHPLCHPVHPLRAPCAPHAHPMRSAGQPLCHLVHPGSHLSIPCHPLHPINPMGSLCQSGHPMRQPLHPINLPRHPLLCWLPAHQVCAAHACVHTCGHCTYTDMGDMRLGGHGAAGDMEIWGHGNMGTQDTSHAGHHISSMGKGPIPQLGARCGGEGQRWGQAPRCLQAGGWGAHGDTELSRAPQASRDGEGGGRDEGHPKEGDGCSRAGGRCQVPVPREAPGAPSPWGPHCTPSVWDTPSLCSTRGQSPPPTTGCQPYGPRVPRVPPEPAPRAKCTVGQGGCKGRPVPSAGHREWGAPGAPESGVRLWQ